MLLSEYATREGHGVIQRLSDAAKYKDTQGRTRNVSYKTIQVACTHGNPIRDYERAEAVSKATGGECSVDEIRKPHLYAKKRRRRSA